MRVTSVLALLFAAGSIAMPVDKRQTDVTVVTEVEYFDQNGNLLSVVYETAAPTPVSGGGSGPTPQPQAPAPPAASSPAPQAPGPAPSPAAPSPQAPPANSPSPPASTPTAVGQNTGGSGGTSVANQVQNYIQQNGNDNTLFVGWVDPTDPKFGEIAVFHHNIHRLNHSASLVEYNTTMAQQAQAWAEKCIGDEEVPAGSGMGMNVAFSSSTTNYNPSYWITGSWYNSEIENYPQYGEANLPVGDGTNFNSWGHFSQVVWPGVTQIGCGVHAGCGGDYDVHSGCYYYVEGNIEGDFNVISQPGGAAIAYPNGLNHM